MTASVRAAAAIGAVAILLAGCGFEGLAFREDRRVAIIRPGDRDTVALPITLSWEVDPAAGAAWPFTYGVVIDRTPPPPGRDLGWLFRDDDTCGDTGCPDPTYRAQRGVFATDATTIDVAAMPTGADRRDEADHEATVFLLDEAGHRVGESAWSVEFSVAAATA